MNRRITTTLIFLIVMRALMPRSTTAAALLCGHRTRAVHGSFIFQTQQNRSQIHCKFSNIGNCLTVTNDFDSFIYFC